MELISRVRAIINPPYTPKDLFIIFSTLIIFVSIPLTVFLTEKIRDLRSKAAFSVPRGVVGDLWADTVIGKPDFSEITPNEVVADKLFIPWGGNVVVDRSVSPGRLYVWDGGNSRVLGIDLATCYAGSSRCSGDIVIGQPSAYDHSACNGDSGFQNYPNRAPASATTLCGSPDNTLSVAEAITRANMAVDGQGNLFVPDQHNNRVLKYNNPFTTDTVADEVWGQDNFTGNLCNKGPGDTTSPTASTLCTWYLGSAVVFDPAGNMWVAESGNHRVVRFPKDPTTGVISKTADLVLGQPNFTTGGRYASGAGLNQMKAPSALAFDAGGSLYVADTENNRVLVFRPTPTFTNGMNASGTFGTNIRYPLGLTADPAGEGLWVTDTDNGMVELWDWDGVTVKKVLGKDTYKPDGGCTALCLISSSVGIDVLGNILVVRSQDYDVYRYSAPIPDPTPGIVYAPSKKLFSPPVSPNLIGAKGLGGGGIAGAAVAANQLIVSDGGNGRLLFWNNPQFLTNGKPADGVIIPGSSTQDFTTKGSRVTFILKADLQHLWVVVNIGVASDIWVYQLPLTTGALPVRKMSMNFPVLGGGTISFAGSPTGIAITPDGNFLWLSHRDTSRVLRIRNPLTSPQVDVILGQKNITGTSCNQGVVSEIDGRNGLASADMLCDPGSLSIDKQGNLFVSDHSLEHEGNFRLLMFSKDLFPTNNAAVIFAPAATKIFPNGPPQPHDTWDPAFDSCNRMVVGYNAFSGSRFVGVYNDPLGPSVNPDVYLKDYYAHAFAAAFDANDNLYMTDLNRAKVLIYKKPLGGSCGGPAPKIGDLNGDNKVDIFDLSILLTNWGASGGAADINKDGTVDIFDLSILLSNWGT